jgi:Tol biopolymer transport system component
VESRPALSGRRLFAVFLTPILVTCLITVRAARVGWANDPVGHYEASGDKGQIAFVSDRDGNAEIYVMAADGTNVVRLTHDPAGDLSPAWSPDGAKIAFVSDRGGNDEIYVMAADGSNQIKLTTSQADEAQPVWSPDGSKIVYYSWKDFSFTIYTMDAGGSNRNELYSDFMWHLAVPSWSPNGTQLAMECWGEGSDLPDICFMDADGTNVSHLPNSAGGERPTWSPDGAMIAFERDDDIYVINVDGSNQNNLTASQAREFWPEWSPKGDKISYEGLDGTAHIYIMDADGSHQVVLVDQGFSWCCQHAYAWSPDGSRIAYVEQREEDGEVNMEISTVTLDEGVPQNVTNSVANEGDPAWRPLNQAFSRVYVPLFIR